MPQKTKKFRSKLAMIVGSRMFFWATIALFVFEALWIALSSRYPMAFDEGTHVGIIKVFSHQWGPLILRQPDGPAPFGPIVHNPSYLYYWLMSFPYRILQASFDQQTTIIILRMVNIAFFAGGLVLFRKVLQRTKASSAIIHAALLFFVLVPIVVLQAGQITYDNLLFLLLAWNLLLVLRFREQLLQKKVCNTSLLAVALSVGMVASLTQYSFLPIFTAIVLYLAFLLWTHRKHVPKLWRKNWRLANAFKKYSALVMLAITLGLFVEMYGINLVKYHNIAPQCNQILSIDRCMASAPWARNYNYAQHRRPDTNHNPIVYTGGWISGMIQRSFFVINGPSGPAPYANYAPLPLMLVSGLAIFATGFILVVRYGQRIVGSDPVLSILLFVSVGYIVALWGKLYYDYVHLDRLVAVNGRYLLVAILPIFILIALAYREWLRSRWQGWALAVALILFMQGGGFISFIYFSNANWYWPHSPTILRLNEDAQHIVRPLTVNWPFSWKL